MLPAVRADAELGGLLSEDVPAPVVFAGMLGLRRGMHDGLRIGKPTSLPDPATLHSTGRIRATWSELGRALRRLNDRDLVLLRA